MLEQKDLAKLEIQGVASGTTLEELITLSVAVEGAIRILDARSKQIAEELKNLLAKQKALKKNVFEDAPEEDDADIINNNSGGGSEDEKVLADPTDSTPATLSEKLAVDKSAADLLSFVVTQKTPEDNTLSLTAAGAAPSGIVWMGTRYDYDEGKEYTALTINHPDNSGIPYIYASKDDKGNILSTSLQYFIPDATKYGFLWWGVDNLELREISMPNLSATGFLWWESDKLELRTISLSDVTEYSSILESLAQLISTGRSGFLKVSAGTLELVDYATCDDSSNGDTLE